MKSLRMKLMAIALVMVMAIAAPVSVPFAGNITVAEAATARLSETQLQMEISATTTLKMIGSKGKVAWKTSNKKVASVTSKGVVTAQSEGTATITATVNKKKYTCTVTVVPARNPYQVSADLQEVEMADLSFVVRAVYEVSGEEVAKGSYQVKLALPDSLSGVTLIAEKTGKKASSYEEIKASLKDVNQKTLQANMDAAYGAGAAKVSKFDTFAYESQNGNKSFAYSFMLDTASGSCRMISYHVSIDDYSLEIITTDFEGYDIYADAEYLIDSLMYIK